MQIIIIHVFVKQMLEHKNYSQDMDKDEKALHIVGLFLASRKSVCV